MGHHRPAGLEEALGLLGSGRARPLAGGTDLFAAVRGPELVGDIVDLSAILALSGITHTPAGWRIGATTRWREIARAELPAALRALQQAAREVGSVQIQNAGTIGGNICNASPAADGVPPLLTLAAEVEIASCAGVRRQPLAQFILGVRKIALAPGEIVSAVLIPEAATRGHSAFVKLGARRYLVISIVMAAARVECAAGRIVEAAIAVGACSPVALRLSALETALSGCRADLADVPESTIAAALTAALAPIGDVRADAPYRLQAAVELVRRVVLAACAGEQAGGRAS